MESPAAEQERQDAWKGAALVFLGATAWSTGGLGVKWLTAEAEWPAMLVSGFRAVFAGLVFLVAARGRVLPPKGKAARWFWLGAFSYAMVITGFVAATFMTTAANAIFIQDTMPVWVLLLSVPLLGERPTRRDAFAIDRKSVV